MKLYLFRCKTLLVGIGTGLALNISSAAAVVDKSQKSEPTIEQALKWWAPQRNVWTPIGWKDHLLRFQVPYNGALLCTPAGWLEKPHTKKYQGKDFQLTFYPSADGALPPLPREHTKLYKIDGGTGIQGWKEGSPAPVLWTEWPSQDGVVMRKAVFAHVKGGAEIESGVEPLYAWVRLSVAHVDPIRAPARFSFGIQLSRVHYDVGGTLEDSVFLMVRPDKAPLPYRLKGQSILGEKGSPGMRVEGETDQLTRLVALPGGDGIISFSETETNSGMYTLRVDLPVRLGAHADLLVPMLAERQAEIAAEADLGFDAALVQAEKFWEKKPTTAARIVTPEVYINRALERNIQFAQIIAERNPDNGEYSFLSGSYGYDTLWSTPSSMISHMFLDLLGYHDVVEKHAQLYKTNQGTVAAPGANLPMHPGYFSTPKTLTSIDWLSDHGAILEILSRHALLTGDQKFINEWLDPILKGCDFIQFACNATNHSGVKGVMPPAVATDTGVPVQAIWNQAWTYKGLSTSIELLRQLKHPRAPELERFAEEFKESFQSAFLAQAGKEPTWVDRDGKTQRLLPSFLVPPPSRHVYDDAFLLDTGPLVLPWAGLFDADDPRMHAFTEFFREGPNHRLRGPQTGAITRAVLTHEISTCEPCYSWNIVNSWKTGDRQKFLEGMYSLLAGAISTQTFINCEHRNAMYGNVFVAPLMTWCLRQSVLDDQLKTGELHLLRLVPPAWASSTQETIFENMPTAYGPVDLRFRKSSDGKTLEVKFAGHWRQKPQNIVVHAPPLPGLSKILLNGKRHPAQGTIRIR